MWLVPRKEAIRFDWVPILFIHLLISELLRNAADTCSRSAFMLCVFGVPVDREKKNHLLCVATYHSYFLFLWETNHNKWKAPKPATRRAYNYSQYSAVHM